jgi:hypothetical protein
MALGHCPGRRTCREARRLNLHLEGVSDEDMPVSDVVTVPPFPSTTAPLTAAAVEEDGTSQAEASEVPAQRMSIL